MTSYASTSTLQSAWRLLLQEQPNIRARDAATYLKVSEAELVACRLGEESIRLRPEWKLLLGALANLGEVMALTRNEHCVHERRGCYRELSVAANGRMGLVVSADIDLRLFLSGWSYAFAVDEPTVRGTLRSLQIFDRQGIAIHKVYLSGTSDLAAWELLKARFCEEVQSAKLDLDELPAKAEPHADSGIDIDALKAGWAALKDTHHFHALLQNLNVARTQALRLVGSEWAHSLPVTSLPHALELAAAREVPIMVFVGNRHCIQIHTGPVSNLAWRDSWFNVLDPAFNLHLQTTGVSELWLVRKPSVDGLITSLEAFSAEGELVVQLFGARKPGQPELMAWSQLAESLR
ncbi:ChuX/HutX family heme-like substrate-binding protein [Pseudomonas oryzihabitans]|uniref:hemin-degrading factor n=1 Tax=Pseudomonas oryzihabitans TaxID=47885 RepID=UPI002893E27A|nr:ChuX/HutX family heme-like substrate-binding protein [Pseudomonas oryzihabitans]MDT3723140.1 ChuX/HutX family heme-like substrate-binding protein [Pseudomonas oryzihabitans]